MNESIHKMILKCLQYIGISSIFLMLVLPKDHHFSAKYLHVQYWLLQFQVSKGEKKAAPESSRKIPIVYRSVERKHSPSSATDSLNHNNGARIDRIQITVKNDPKEQTGDQSPAAIVSYEPEPAAEFEAMGCGPERDVRDMGEDIENQAPAPNAHEILDAKFQQYKKELNKQRYAFISRPH
jgi:hypothetical protein